MRKLSEIYTRFNNDRVFDYPDNRAHTFHSVQKKEAQEQATAKRFSLGGPKGLQDFRKVLKINAEMVQNGEITMEEFMRKTRPIIERSEFEATSKVRQNIRNISEMQ